MQSVWYYLIINICKNAYRYFKIVDKIFEKLQHVYEESLERQSINVSDYILFYKQMFILYNNFGGE